jgi:transcriptional regulator with XRE-family HTH domain
MDYQNNLIDLVGYRRRYGLKQSDVARFFETSASFVSLVEKGNAKLSTKSMENFWANAGDKRYGLVPAFDRLVQLGSALHKQGRYSNFFLYDPDDEGSYYEPFEEWLTRDAVLSIKYGIVGISDSIVNTLQESFTPKINKEWLLTGVGEMFTNDTISVLVSDVGRYYEQLWVKMNECGERLSKMEGKIDEILRLLKERS